MTSEATCERLQRALSECHRRVASGPGRDFACRHLNHALAVCLVSLVCHEESEAVRTLCSSSGTALKRSQCQQIFWVDASEFESISPGFLGLR